MLPCSTALACCCTAPPLALGSRNAVGRSSSPTLVTQSSLSGPLLTAWLSTLYLLPRPHQRAREPTLAKAVSPSFMTRSLHPVQLLCVKLQLSSVLTCLPLPREVGVPAHSSHVFLACKIVTVHRVQSLVFWRIQPKPLICFRNGLPASQTPCLLLPTHTLLQTCSWHGSPFLLDLLVRPAALNTCTSSPSQLGTRLQCQTRSSAGHPVPEP